MKLSVIMPVYNEENNLLDIINRVQKANIGKIEKEIIIVDDASNDKSWDVLQDVKSKHKNIVLIKHKFNGGKGRAIRTGLNNANGDLYIIQDSDLEYDPSEYKKLISALNSKNGKHKVVFGSRFIKSNKEQYKKNKFRHKSHYFGNKLLTSFTNILFFSRLTDMETCYKLFTREVYDKIKPLKSKRFNFEPEITAKILKNGFKIKEVPISYNGRSFSEGKKISWRDGVSAVLTLIYYRMFD